MPTAESRTAPALAPWDNGLWRLSLGAAGRVLSLVTDRSAAPDRLTADPRFQRRLAFAEQVHGAGIAALEAVVPPPAPIPGCDALMTQVPGLALAIRSADCLPLSLWDPVQGVAALAHAGWRGLALHLPMRMVVAIRQRYHSRPEDLQAGIGPAIRACCYDVRADVARRFEPYVRRAAGRVTCDLVRCAVDGLRAAGVLPSRIVDSGACTACEPERWHSVRRDGPTAGRLVSLIMVQP